MKYTPDKTMCACYLATLDACVQTMQKETGWKGAGPNIGLCIPSSCLSCVSDTRLCLRFLKRHNNTTPAGQVPLYVSLSHSSLSFLVETLLRDTASPSSSTVGVCLKRLCILRFIIKYITYFNCHWKLLGGTMCIYLKPTLARAQSHLRNCHTSINSPL